MIPRPAMTWFSTLVLSLAILASPSLHASKGSSGDTDDYPWVGEDIDASRNYRGYFKYALSDDGTQCLKITQLGEKSKVVNQRNCAALIVGKRIRDAIGGPCKEETGIGASLNQDCVCFNLHLTTGAALGMISYSPFGLDRAIPGKVSDKAASWEDCSKLYENLGFPGAGSPVGAAKAIWDSVEEDLY